MGGHIWHRHHKGKTLRAVVEQSDVPRKAFKSGAIDLRSEPFSRVREADREHDSLELAQAFADSTLDELHICNDTCSDWQKQS
jgi:hypothetical protein